MRRSQRRHHFRVREPVATSAPREATGPRLYRTGRNIQFSVKVTQELQDQIYALTDELAQRTQAQVPGLRWTVGMTIERMVAALRRELGKE